MPKHIYFKDVKYELFSSNETNSNNYVDWQYHLSKIWPLQRTTSLDHILFHLDVMHLLTKHYLSFRIFLVKFLNRMFYIFLNNYRKLMLPASAASILGWFNGILPKLYFNQFCSKSCSILMMLWFKYMQVYKYIY